MNNKKRAALGAGAVLLLAVGIGMTVLLSDMRDLSVETKPAIKDAAVTSRQITENSQRSASYSSRSPRGREDSEGSISPSEARRLMETIRENSNIMERSAESLKIVEALCKAGYVAEAWELIEANPGQVRSSMLTKFFRSSGLSVEEMALKVSSLPYKGDASDALRGYLKSLDADSLGLTLASPSFKDLKSTLDEKDPGAVNSALTQYLIGIDRSDRVDRVELASNLLKSGLLNLNGYAQAVEAEDALDAFGKWDKLGLLDDQPHSNSPASQIRRETIQAIIDQDAPRAIDRLKTLSGVNGALDLNVGVKAWGVIDPVAANDWFVKNSAQLIPRLYDAAALAFYQIALDQKEMDVAEAWAKNFKDEALRNKALARIKK